MNNKLDIELEDYIKCRYLIMYDENTCRSVLVDITQYPLQAYHEYDVYNGELYVYFTLVVPDIKIPQPYDCPHFFNRIRIGRCTAEKELSSAELEQCLISIKNALNKLPEVI